jgi:hypothetical protein
VSFKKRRQCFFFFVKTLNARGRDNIPTPIKMLIELNTLCRKEDFE